MEERDRIQDGLLVLQCQEGGADAFEELLGRWQHRLWRHAWRLVGREDAAWDVLQDSLLAIAAGLGRLDDAAAFGAWAYRIVTNKSRDWIRKESRRRDAHNSYAAHRRRDEEVQPSGERFTSLKEAVASLPGKDRAVLSLKYEEGFDIEEIASILDVPSGTVKSRLYHARERLRKAVEVGKHE